MNTRVLLDHEPVADGGFVARAVLMIEGVSSGSDPTGPDEASIHAATRVAAENVHIAVRPGRDAEFIQMRHTFESEGSGNVLTIMVGDVRCLDRIRIRMDALVGPGAGVDGEADVGQLVVLAHLRTANGLELQTVKLPIRVSTRYGGRIRPDVRRIPISGDGDRVPRPYTPRSRPPDQCA